MMKNENKNSLKDRMENAKTAQNKAMEEIKEIPQICISNLSPEEVVEMLGALGELIASETQDNPAGAENENKVQRRAVFDNKYSKAAMADIHEGVGEKVFVGMLEDMLQLTSLCGMLYETLYYLANGRMERGDAMSRGVYLLETADETLKKWQEYAMPKD